MIHGLEYDTSDFDKADNLAVLQVRKLKSTFPVKLYDMINKENGEIVEWINEGKAFGIKDMDLFLSDICPKYFKFVNNMNGFRRMMTMYGFDKLKMKPGKDVRIFSHPCFQRDREDLLGGVRRISTGKAIFEHPSTPSVDEMKIEYEKLCKDRQENLMQGRKMMLPKVASDASGIQKPRLQEVSAPLSAVPGAMGGSPSLYPHAYPYPMMVSHPFSNSFMYPQHAMNMPATNSSLGNFEFPQVPSFPGYPFYLPGLNAAPQAMYYAQSAPFYPYRGAGYGPPPPFSFLPPPGQGMAGPSDLSVAPSQAPTPYIGTPASDETTKTCPATHTSGLSSPEVSSVEEQEAQAVASLNAFPSSVSIPAECAEIERLSTFPVASKMRAMGVSVTGYPMLSLGRADSGVTPPSLAYRQYQRGLHANSALAHRAQLETSTLIPSGASAEINSARSLMGVTGSPGDEACGCDDSSDMALKRARVSQEA